jgi:predicted transglutaminase-like cysteine proteinase
MSSVLARTLRCVSAAVAAIIVLVAVPAEGQIIRRDAMLPAISDFGQEPFGLSTTLAPAGTMWVRWREFETGVQQNADAITRCRSNPATCSAAETRLIALIDVARHASGRAKFGLVNREINLSIAYTSDVEQHGSGDVWSSALATFTSGQGDCEDFAIAKYLTLREAGVPVQDLRLLVGRVSTTGGAHAVLAARLDGHWLILDNRRMAMVEDEHAFDLQPLFAFDSVGVKEFGGRAFAVAAAPAQTPAAEIRQTATSQADIRPALAGDAMLRGETLPLLI